MKRLSKIRACVWIAVGTLCATMVAMTAPAVAADWPQFRGPGGRGVSTEPEFPVRWDRRTNVRWRTPLPGPGNGSPIVVRGRVFLNQANKDGTRRSLLCFDRRDGKLLWERAVAFDRVEKTHQTNPYESPTPASDGTCVVTWHGSAGLFCYDLDGDLQWQIDLGDVHHIWGYASSPIIHDGRVFQQFGPGVETFMAAVDLKTGKLLWKTDEPGGANDRNPRMVGSFGTPVIVEVDGRPQLIAAMPTRVVAYDPDTGAILWTCRGLSSPRGDLVYTSPVVAGDILVVMAGYKGPAMAIRLGGNRGDGVAVGPFVYVANAGPGIIQCLEAATGKVRWQARMPGGNAWASTIYAGGLLYSTDQSATSYVYKADPDAFRLVATNALNEPCNATPAFSDGEIFIRTHAALYCISEKAPAAGR